MNLPHMKILITTSIIIIVQKISIGNGIILVPNKIFTESIEALQEKAFADSKHQEEIIEDISINIKEQVHMKTQK